MTIIEPYMTMADVLVNDRFQLPSEGTSYMRVQEDYDPKTHLFYNATDQSGNLFYFSLSTPVATIWFADDEGSFSIDPAPSNQVMG